MHIIDISMLNVLKEYTTSTIYEPTPGIRWAASPYLVAWRSGIENQSNKQTTTVTKNITKAIKTHPLPKCYVIRKIKERRDCLSHFSCIWLHHILYCCFSSTSSLLWHLLFPNFTCMKIVEPRMKLTLAPRPKRLPPREWGKGEKRILPETTGCFSLHISCKTSLLIIY